MIRRLGKSVSAEILTGEGRELAIELIRKHHYSRSVPSGKSHYLKFEDAIIVWSIPANKNLSGFVLSGEHGSVWELSRLWAPDGHRKNLLSKAISEAVKVIRELEHPDALVSYADPNVGHSGGVYRAASWVYHGQSEEARYYRDASGKTVSRRSFHSGKKSLKKSDIIAMGYSEFKLPGKHRFVKPISKMATRIVMNQSRKL